MLTWKSVLPATMLGALILFTQACQRTDQQTAENQPPANGSAAPSNAPGATVAPSSPTTSGTPAAPPSAPAAAPKSAPAAASSAPSSRPATPAKPASITVPIGTDIKVRTTHTLSTKTVKSGDGFEAVLDEPLVLNGKELFPRGATVMGTVTDSDPGGKVQGVASMALELTMLHTPSGQMVMISTRPVSVQAKTSKTKDAEKIGAGAAIGAAIGAIAGGGKGAGIGAAAGGGAGTAVVLGTRGDAAEIPAESVLNFSLSSPVTISR